MWRPWPRPTGPARLAFPSPWLSPLQDLCVRGELDRVVQRREFSHSAATEGAPDQVVRQVRVLRQQRAMQVRADNAALDTPFEPVATVVARSDANSAKRPRAGSEKSASAVVLESDERRRVEVFERRVHDHVADE